MFFSNRLIKYATNQKEIAFGITAIEGIGIHSFVDGIIYSVTFSASILTGFLAGTGLVIHEFAEGVITYSILIEGGFKEKKAAIYALLVASLTTPLGAFIAYPFINKLSSSILGLALGFDFKNLGEVFTKLIGQLFLDLPLGLTVAAGQFAALPFEFDDLRILRPAPS